MSRVTVKFDGRTAIGLRYVLPLCAEAVRHADPDGSSDTTAMLDEAAQRIDRALPPDLRGAIDDHKVAERRMDVIDSQRKAGVRRDPRYSLAEVREALLGSLYSDGEATTGLAGPLGEAIADVSGSYSLEFTTPEQVAEGICNWLAAALPSTDREGER
jgi:hypothetical protein